MNITLWQGSSKWTSAGRNHSIHLAHPKMGGYPACGKTYRNGCLDRWEGNSSEITCPKCKQIFKTQAC